MADSRFIKWENDTGLYQLSLGYPPGIASTGSFPVTFRHLMQFWPDDIKGLIISGTGRKFNTDAEGLSVIHKFSGTNDPEQNMMLEDQALGFILNLQIPVLAAIDGLSFGRGFEIATACDIRFCTRESLFYPPEVLPEHVEASLRRKSLTETGMKLPNSRLNPGGDLLNAHKALELKIVDRIVPDGNCIDYGRHFISGMIKNRPLKVIQALVISFRNHATIGHDEALSGDVKLFCDLAKSFASQGFSEG